MDVPLRSFRRLKTVLWVVAILAIGGLAFLARSYNLHDTLIFGRIYFVDGDCYARMTRAQLILEHPGMVIHHHDFENWPRGVHSHTTAPFDYAIVLLKWLLDALRVFPEAQRLDVAGALISPIIGTLTCLYLGWWARWGISPNPEGRQPMLALVVPLFFATSTILVHGTVLGRPDHQAPVILLLAVALSAELNLLGEATHRRAWSAVAGVAWGLALWISLFEPLLLFLGTLLTISLMNWRRVWVRHRLWELAPLATLLGLMLLVEGSPIPELDPQVGQYFTTWSRSVSELERLDLHGLLLYDWLGFGCWAAPVLLLWGGRRDRRAWAALVLLAAMFGTTYDHRRWGYFLALAYALSLPWQLVLLRRLPRPWIAYTAGVVALLLSCYLPFASEWELMLFPDDVKQRENQQTQRERILLRQVAANMKDVNGDRLPFLAPWWLSPALAYWSGQPGVAGSSHEGMSGIVESARFYLAATPGEASDIVRDRAVRLVILDDPERTIPTSEQVLDIQAPARPLGRTLYQAPHRPPPFLSLEFKNEYYRLFSVKTEQLEPSATP